MGSKSKTLSADQKQFFRLVSQAAFSNPFSVERDDLDRKIANATKDVKPSELLNGVRYQINAHLEPIRASDLSVFNQEDKELIRSAMLFKSFHDFSELFDQHIQDQSKSLDPLPVPFAGAALKSLHPFGDQEACRYFAIFYQMRRAWYFLGSSLIGQSLSMVNLRKHLWSSVFTIDSRWYESHFCERMEDFSTLLLGETGTGKGAVAAAIGRSGYIPFDMKKNCFVASFTKSFVSINLSAYADTLIESELFGHRKGAFTGAIDNFSGVFERCSRYGSIFLDEVGDVSLPLQVKLLNVLQDRQFAPVGSHSQQRFEGRVIAATNKSLDELRTKGEFRNDFYYRLCSDVITLPTLRQRIAEEPREFELILKHVISKTLGRDDKSMSQKLVQMVKTEIPKDYPWPGNVRELEQCIRRLVVSGYYGGEDLPQTPLDTNISALVDAGKVSAHDLLSIYCRQLYAIHGSYEEVARIASLDRRTVKKYIVQN